MIHLDRDGDIPLVEQIVSQLAGLIQEGQMPPGTRLPSIRKLAATLQASSATVVAAYDRLVARGLLESRASSGFFVARQRAPRAGTLQPLVAAPREQIDAIWMMRRMLQPQDGRLRAGSGFLPEQWLEDTLSTRLLARMARKGQRAYVAPPSAEGYAPLRAQLALKLGLAGIPVTATQIVMTCGVTQAFDVIGRALLSPGDTVLVEEPGYFALFAQLRAMGAKLVPVPRLSDGPDVDALANACALYRPKLFFTQTLLHNPTGGSTDPVVAHRLLQVAERHDLLLVEDDIYGDLHPGGNPLRLAQLDRLERVIYTSSFTKVLSPNMRVGFLAAPPRLVDLFLEQKLLALLATSEFDERLVYELLADGGYRKHVERLRVKLAQQRAAVVRHLAEAGLAPQRHGDGGMNIWAELPAGVDVEALVRDAEEQGILLAPGSIFFLRQEAVPWLRFNASTSNDERLYAYLRRALQGIAESNVGNGETTAASRAS